MECNVNQCYDNTPLKRPNTPPLLGVAPNTLTQPANTPRCQLNTLVCCHNTPWAVTPLKPTGFFFFNSVVVLYPALYLFNSPEGTGLYPSPLPAEDPSLIPPGRPLSTTTSTARPTAAFKAIQPILENSALYSMWE